jgi:proline-specific peptidase
VLTRRLLLTGALASVASARAVNVMGRPADGSARPPPPDPRAHDPDVGALREGVANVPGGRVYFRVYGRPSDHPPVVVVHGGPAAGHRYMRPYAALATDREAVLWDQLGCGRSDAPSDTSLYTVERYIDEVDALTDHLGWRRFVLLGHSWGGWLGQAYALARPARLAGLAFAGTSSSIACMQRASNRYLAEYGPEAVALARRAERDGNYEAPDVQALTMRFYQDHLCRLDPWPQWFVEEGEKVDANPVYRLMNGPSEFAFTGTLKDFDVTARVHEIRAPTLVTCGQFDYGSADCGRVIQSRIRGSRLVVYDGLSHMSHVEDPVRVVGTVGRWLKAMG